MAGAGVQMATTLGIKVDAPLQERLRRMAELQDHSVHWVIKRAIEQYLEREEAIARDREEDHARWEQYALTGDALPNAAVLDWLDGQAAGSDPP